MKIVRGKIVIFIFVVLVCIAFYSYKSYFMAELESTKSIVVMCQIDEVGRVLNEYYSVNSAYPELANNCFSGIDFSHIKCGESQYSSCGMVLDPWGSQIRAKKVSDKEIEIYSINFDRLILVLSKGTVKSVI